jgi:hypothetical protein
MSVLAVTAACGVDPLAISTTDFTAKLDGASEVPAVTTTATGTATANRVGSTIVYSVTYSGLSGAPTASHIHIGAQGAAGPVRFNFCGTGAPVPACPTGVAGTISGTGDATFLAGGISLDSLNSAMKAGNAYVNIHTATNAGGEIRGLLVGKR